MTQAVIADSGWSFCLLILFMWPLLIIFEVHAEQYKRMVSNNRQEGFRGVLQLRALSAFVFRFLLWWQMSFICPNGLDCNMTSSETIFVIFADSLSVPLWLLKSQDIYVPAGALGMAEPGFRVWAAQNKPSVVFSSTSRAVLFQVLEIHPEWRCPTLCTCRVALGKAGRRAQAVAAAEPLQAATPLFLCPETLLSLVWIQKVMSVNFSSTDTASRFTYFSLQTRLHPVRSYFWLTQGFGNY